MMKRSPGMSDQFLLDTHVLVWAVSEPKRLARDVRPLIEENRYAVSVATLWELVNKKDKAAAPVRDPAALVGQLRRTTADRRPSGPSQPHPLPGPPPAASSGPFDRILIAQAAVEGMTLVTADSQIHAYGIGACKAER
jgi:PIN domain nuclease of toxin-antitoxin system